MPTSYNVFLSTVDRFTYIEKIIYVDTDPEQEIGHEFHIKKMNHGGMELEVLLITDPRCSPGLIAHELLGQVRVSDMQRFEATCASVEVSDDVPGGTRVQVTWANDTKRTLIAQGVMTSLL
jgi:hypothetical protein